MRNTEKNREGGRGASTVFILGGGMVRGGERWRTTRYDEGDTKAALGDYVRVAAAHAFYKRNPDIRFVVLGGKGQYSTLSDAPPVAVVMRGELLSFGVPADSIETEERSGTTWQQLQVMKRLLPKESIARILTNRYHVPRVRALLEKDLALSALYKDGKVLLVSAEEVLIEDDPKAWGEVIDAAYATEAMKERIRLEGEGVRQIRDGTYQLK